MCMCACVRNARAGVTCHHCPPGTPTRTIALPKQNAGECMGVASCAGGVQMAMWHVLWPTGGASQASSVDPPTRPCIRAARMATGMALAARGPLALIVSATSKCLVARTCVLWC